MANVKTMPQPNAAQEETNDPQFHAANIERMLDDLTKHMREDIDRVNGDPRAQALFETSAEVLEGLRKAYHDFQTKSEKAWK